MKTEVKEEAKVVESKNDSDAESKPICGIVMPISATDGCTAEHWGDVLNILRDITKSAGFEPNLVSDADDVGIIQKRIVQNIYSNDIVICDVSAKNPNVMFELGLRLAFDKATIIIKDDFTDYSFDTSIIEHLGYPRDLRFNLINDFREKLRNKLIATHKKSKEDSNYSTFLKSFGEFKLAQLQTKVVSSEDFILESLAELRYEIRRLRQTRLTPQNRKFYDDEHLSDIEGREKASENGLYCVEKSVLRFAESNHLFQISELIKEMGSLIEFVRNDSHIVDEHPSIIIDKNTITAIMVRNTFNSSLARLRKKADLKQSNNLTNLKD